jgi:hypothetical protein
MRFGDVPVRDFVDPGWPLTYLLSAAAWSVAGGTMWVEWAVVSVAFACGAALTVVAAERLSGSVAIAIMVTAFEVISSPRTYAYPKILPYAAFAAIVVHAGAPSTRRLSLLGLMIAFAFLLRHDHGVWIGLATGVYITLTNRGGTVRTALGRGAVVVGTTLGLLLPWLIFLALNGSAISYVETALEFARAEANASTLKTWPWFGTASNPETWLFWLFWGLPVAAAVLVVRRSIRGHESWPGQLAAVGTLVVLAACVNAGFLRDLLRTRIADAVVPASLLGAWLLGIPWTGTWRHPAARRLARLASALVVAVSYVAIAQLPEVRDRIERANLGVGIRGVTARLTGNARLLRLPHRQAEVPPSRPAAALMPFFEYLDRCSAQTDRLIVTGEYPDIGVLAARPFASDGVVFGAWYSSSVRQDRTLGRLRGRPALFVILLDEPGFRARFPVIAAYIDNEYQPLATIEEPGLRVPILVHARRTAPRVDMNTGWPCFI